MLKKSFFIFLISTLFLSFFSSCTPSENNRKGSAFPVKGSVIGLSGTVLINGNEVVEGADVRDGSIIQTDEEGYCEISFLQGNIIKIYEDTLMELSFSQAMVNIDRGAAAAILRNISFLLKDEDDLFYVESGNMVAGIRGTSFFIRKEDAVTTYFCLCNGALDLSDPRGRVEIPLRATHHSAVRIREIEGEFSMSRAALEYHSDREMEELAARIGQKMDWSVQEYRVGYNG